MKLAPVTAETPSTYGRGVQTDDVGGVRLSGMTPSLASNHRRNNGTTIGRENHNHRYINIFCENSIWTSLNLFDSV